jgi:hypothetical protein
MSLQKTLYHNSIKIYYSRQLKVFENFYNKKKLMQNKVHFLWFCPIIYRI